MPSYILPIRESGNKDPLPSPDIGSSRTITIPSLNELPADILLIILSYMDTARSVAHLAAASKGLYQLVSTEGWRIFVKNCFGSLKLPANGLHDDWADLARALTAQSRDWDRRAFIFHSLSPPEARRPGARRNQAAQSIPGNIIVDAHLQRRGRFNEEIVVWGSGEDVVARFRQSDRATVVSESWHRCGGSETGFAAGKGDTTAVSIAKSHAPGSDDDGLGVVIGRANGDLRWLGVGESNFGHTLMHFRPSSSFSLQQCEIQAIDVDSDHGIMAASTKESVWLYPIQTSEPTGSDGGSVPSHVDPVTAVSLRDAQKPFDFIRSTKMLNRETIAVALNRSFDPIRVLNITPTGLEMTSARTPNEYPYITSAPRTVRALLPVDVRSIASGGGNVLLSSWDDGTIRLQDLRTPSPLDRVYQDNFEVSTPINALISHGLERFVAGSAYSHMLKVFDFRWTRGYYHTDSLPCTSNRPYPTPRPPTIVDEPRYHNNQPRCSHVSNRLCRWHALSRHNFYRPNCNIYLPFRNYASSPIYSLAKPSDFSPTVYAGLSGLLVEFTLKSGMQTAGASNPSPLYVRQKGKVAILETGDGSAISDISKCQRVPEIRRQSFSHGEHENWIARRRHRLDEALQDRREWQEPEPVAP